MSRRRTPRAKTPAASPRLLGALAVLGGLAAALAAGAQFLLDPQRFPVRVVAIEGQFQRVPRAELEQAVAPHVRGGFFEIDLAAVRRAAEAHPWVDRASVRRIWPGRLRIAIEEQVPLARWGETAMVNRRGEPFTPAAATIPSGLPLLVGPREQLAEAARRFPQMHARLADVGLALARLEVDARGSWSFAFAGGTEVVLGTRELDPRFERFVRLYPALTTDARVAERFDLRYPNGLAVRWREAALSKAAGAGSGSSG